MKTSKNNTTLIQTINDLFVKIPSGSVELRDDRIKKRWTSEIDSFLLSKYPVTQDIYQQVTGLSPSTFKGDHKPIETVSWAEAVMFCNSLSSLLGLNPCYTTDGKDEMMFKPKENGIRLPTEAEWQYACQAGTGTIRYGELDDIAWYKGDSLKSTQDVGKKQPNDWGLYDMLGNVWEWCSNIYDETVYGSYRIFRGGGWNDEERSVMATTRRRSHPKSFRIDDLGFRIARNKA